KQSIVIKRSSGLSRDEVERMEREAAEFAVQDHEQKEMINARIKGETLVMEAERSITKYKGHVEGKFIEAVTTYLVQVRDALLVPDPSPELKGAVAGLDRALLELGRAIYSGGAGRASERSE